MSATGTISKPGSAAGAPPKSVAREYLETIVICVLFLLLARGFVFMQSKIPTGSMLDTLLIGDYILVDRFLYGGPTDSARFLPGTRDVRRGDVIVFRFPEDPDLDFVKRVIALPGERLEMRDGTVFINGQALDEPYLLPENVNAEQDFAETTIGADEFFCMGDNRDDSRDSRAWGPVPRSMIKGRAFFIWYSYMEDRNDHFNTGLRRWFSIGKKVLGFPTKTRWKRLFTLIH